MARVKIRLIPVDASEVVDVVTFHVHVDEDGGMSVFRQGDVDIAGVEELVGSLDLEHAEELRRDCEVP